MVMARFAYLAVACDGAVCWVRAGRTQQGLDCVSVALLGLRLLVVGADTDDLDVDAAAVELIGGFGEGE